MNIFITILLIISTTSQPDAMIAPGTSFNATSINTITVPTDTASPHHPNDFYVKV